MNLSTNCKVKTPYGEGIVNGMFIINDNDGKEIARGIGVRMEVNDKTRQLLSLSNCVTPHAIVSGIWIFDEKEISL